MTVKFLLDNYYLVIALLVSGGFLAWPLFRDRAGGPKLGTLAATQLMNQRDVQIVDVRTDKPVLVVCEAGRRAALAAVKLRSAGIGEVYILDGGLGAWRAAGLPVAKTA